MNWAGDRGIDRQMRERMDLLPLKEFPLFQIGAPYFFDWLEHPSYDDYWRKLVSRSHHAKINVPAFNIGGWYDIFQGGTLRNYLGMRRAGATPRRARPAPDGRPVEPCAAAAEHGRRGRFRLSRGAVVGRP